MKPITEDHIESFAIEQLQSLGWEYIHGLAFAPCQNLLFVFTEKEDVLINICC